MIPFGLAYNQPGDRGQMIKTPCTPLVPTIAKITYTEQVMYAKAVGNS